MGVDSLNWAALLVTEGAVHDEQVVHTKKNEDVKLHFFVELCDQGGAVKQLAERLSPFCAKSAELDDIADVSVSFWWLACCGKHRPKLGSRSMQELVV